MKVDFPKSTQNILSKHKEGLMASQIKLKEGESHRPAHRWPSEQGSSDYPGRIETKPKLELQKM